MKAQSGLRHQGFFNLLLILKTPRGVLNTQVRPVALSTSAAPEPVEQTPSSSTVPPLRSMTRLAWESITMYGPLGCRRASARWASRSARSACLGSSGNVASCSASVSAAARCSARGRPPSVTARQIRAAAIAAAPHASRTP